MFALRLSLLGLGVASNGWASRGGVRGLPRRAPSPIDDRVPAGQINKHALKRYTRSSPPGKSSLQNSNQRGTKEGFLRERRPLVHCKPFAQKLASSEQPKVLSLQSNVLSISNALAYRMKSAFFPACTFPSFHLFLVFSMHFSAVPCVFFVCSISLYPGPLGCFFETVPRFTAKVQSITTFFCCLIRWQACRVTFCTAFSLAWLVGGFPIVLSCNNHDLVAAASGRITVVVGSCSIS